MSTLRFACCDELRRTSLRGHPTLNGIDGLLVEDLDVSQLNRADTKTYNARPPSSRDEVRWQKRLTIEFVNPLTPQQRGGIKPEMIQIEGGERIRDLRAAVISIGASSAVLYASAAGDFSQYTLRLVRSDRDPWPPAGFDPALAHIDFSFKVDCPSDFDCRAGHVCRRAKSAEPPIDYLAKDYASFRRLMLDRLALVAPDWRERNPADLGIALVELLAYVGDRLSYEQDAAASEGYLGTARRRISLRRLAKLVDYAVSEGCNARAWLFVEVTGDAIVPAAELRCFTAVAGLPERVIPASPDEATALGSATEWFEPVGPDPDPSVAVADVALYLDHNVLRFHTWGDEQCCLPIGSTGATLLGSHPDLRLGDVLLFEEVLGPTSGNTADADPTHRQAVRLTSVVSTDGGGPLVDPIDGTPITEIEWCPEDALELPVWVSGQTATGAALNDVSVARGNIVLVDHGLTIAGEDLGVVSSTTLGGAPTGQPAGCAGDDGCYDAVDATITRFRPQLSEGPLSMVSTVRVTQQTPGGRRTKIERFDPAGSATAAVQGRPEATRPSLAVTSVLEGTTRPWTAVPDLLASRGTDLDLVVEAESDGSATLRFGDDEHGRRPEPGERFSATYRVGNGRRGNIGPGAICHVISGDARITRVRNPLSGTGGTEPETAEQIRRRAPQVFRTPKRAVTPADYEKLLGRRPGIQRAAATLRWTGSWPTHFLAVDRVDGQRLSPAVEADLIDYVEPFRLAGHDLEFDDPSFVSLDVGLEVCAADDYFRGDVKARLLEILSNRDLPDGRRGIFHSDNFSFGQTVYLSPILAAARSVTGVASARVTTFARAGSTDIRPRDEGRLLLGRLEIARLDNDPNRPENGVLHLDVVGGK